MTQEKIYNNSIVLGVLKETSDRCFYFDHLTRLAYEGSIIIKAAQAGLKELKFFLKHSFFMYSMREFIRFKKICFILEESISFRRIRYLWERSASGLPEVLNSVIIFNLVRAAKERLFCSPVRTVSFMVVIIISTDALLSLLFGKQILLWGWVLRGLYLFAAISGLFCDTAHCDLKKSSIFLRLVLNSYNCKL
ncbi:MAG: hypothetical protein JW788_00775 [Candidatus Omnitrophica bacterium]|nr:hypothetical protein [Candidatus Omnitrophota bacterium]